MHRSLAALLLGAGVFRLIDGYTITARAVEPTASGEIGVNPPDGLGEQSHYVGWIGVDTDYLSLDGSTTKWIGVNTEYVTEVPTTITVDDRPVISHIPLEIVASTATADAEGVAVGDVTLLLSEEFRVALEEEVKEVAISCGAGVKIRKRVEFMSCMIRGGQNVVEQEGGAFDLIAPGTWDGFIIELGGRVPEDLRALLQWGGNRVARNRLRVFVGAVIAAGVGFGIAVENAKVPPKLKFKDGKLGENDPTATATADPTTTSSACNPSGTLNADSPVCEDEEECSGKNGKCTKEHTKDCPCSEWTYPIHEDTYDYAFGDEQQKMLAELLNGVIDDAPPKCFENSDGDGFDGKPMAEPSAWCVCTSAGSTGIYSTMTSQPDPCALQSMPTQTISITHRPKYTGPVTSCKWTTVSVPSTSIGPFCTCNDDNMHGPPVETTTVEDNETKTICVPPEPEVTDRPTPQKLAQCKPKVLPYYYDGPSCTGCNDARPFSEQSPYKAAVHEFCHGGYNFKAKSTGDRDATKWGAALDIFTDSGQENPDTGLPPLCAIHNVLWDGIKRPDSKDLCHADRSWGGDSLFRVAVVLSKDQSGGCGILQDYVIPTGDKCEEMLNIVVDDCIVGEKDDETGGYFLDRSPNGCWEWWIYSKNIL